jgi:hypothetical protein
LIPSQFPNETGGLNYKGFVVCNKQHERFANRSKCWFRERYVLCRLHFFEKNLGTKIKVKDDAKQIFWNHFSVNQTEAPHSLA